jgi:hypothetical protein
MVISCLATRPTGSTRATNRVPRYTSRTSRLKSSKLDDDDTSTVLSPEFLLLFCSVKLQEIKKNENEKTTLGAQMTKTSEEIKTNQSLLANNEATLASLRRQLGNLNYVTESM